MSRQSIPLLTLTLLAGAVVAANRFVTSARIQTVADGNAIGVSRAAAASGAQMPVDVIGTTTVEAGAAFAAGATLKSDIDGKAITWVTAGGRLAVALEAAGAPGDLVEVLLIPNAA